MLSDEDFINGDPWGLLTGPSGVSADQREWESLKTFAQRKAFYAKRGIIAPGYTDQVKQPKIKVESRESYRVRVMNEAMSAAKEFGMSFVVFVGGFADRHCTDVNEAKRQARFEACQHGRKNVRIKCIKV